MAKTAIQVENLSKQYRLGVFSTGMLSTDLKRWWARTRGKEDPFALVTEENDRTGGATQGFVWALKDISFDAKQGEVLGIIGRNGAGKSTLLKVLSQVTPPTTGSVKARGRIASLLEVGTGMHPELTGRENIFLNGAILGMKRPEIAKKLDEIVAFSGCAKYVDTPLKRYSSGMKVRLGFAVAAFLEPEILIVDEVLAVGDAEFQKKSIGKMKEVSEGEGRTVLFVSHNMSSVRNLCNRGIVLANGRSVFEGTAEQAVTHYLTENAESAISEAFVCPLERTGSRVLGAHALTRAEGIQFLDDRITLRFEIQSEGLGRGAFLVVNLRDGAGNMLFISSTDEREEDCLSALTPGKYQLDVQVPGRWLKPGTYIVGFALREREEGVLHREETALTFEVQDELSIRAMKNRYRSMAMVAPEIDFHLQAVLDDA